MMKVESSLLADKPQKILVQIYGLGRTYASQLSKDVDTTYSHAVRVLEMLEALKLVEFETKGRIKYVVIAENAKEYVKTLVEFRKATQKWLEGLNG